MKKKILIVSGVILIGVVLLFIWRSRFRGFFGDKIYSYWICQNEITEEKICEIRECKVDNCIRDFYDNKGTLIENYFKGAGEYDNPETKVKNCQENLLPINWCKMPF